ncbi:hypothetical protein ML462_11335 [Gramella lutea]|uniref:Uncharacterized protein n=1 Tax=Christiangramia lutea TaxID=1607951 RepID=A0A9X1V7B4_9FLAO|nr:hypothetical protein [Christiangramia lutea]MCH4823763.1 hypothetical protein [Christiangramia lutea]
MKFIIKYLALFAVISLVLSSCTKDETVQGAGDVPSDVASLYLGPNLGDYYNQTRQQEQDVPECSDEEPAFAQIRLEYGDDNTVVETIVGISSDEQGLFTEYSEDLEIPIPSGETTVSVTLTDFVVWSDDGGAPGEVIWVAPKEGSEFAMFVDDPLEQTFDLRAGSKNYVNVDVICFDDREVNLYGYQFFDITPVPLYDFCIFANYCTDSGRHYTANYSFSLYEYDGNREDGKGDLIYEDLSPNTGMTEDGTYWADPLCVVIPGPGEGIASDAPYLVFEATLTDWEPYYTAEEDDESMISMTLSWDMIQMLFDEDGNDETTEYYHIFFNCGDEPVECDLDDPDADCDGDGTDNGDDPCPDDATDSCVDECADAGGDSDEDGICDDEDECPNDATNTCNDECADAGGDSDEDGICDDEDECPNDATNTCNDECADAGGDSDGDGICDDEDECPNDATNTCNDPCAGEGGDSDGDGICDDNDACPNENPTVDEDGDGCEDETGTEPCLPDPDSTLNCETASFTGDISNNFPVDIMLDGDVIGSLTFDIEDGDIIVGVALTAIGGYLIDDCEISIGDEIVCYDETSFPGVGSYELDADTDFSYPLNDITVRLNVCPANE